MNKKNELHEKITELKLRKRQLVLAGKSTTKIDEVINLIQEKTKDDIENVTTTFDVNL